MLVAGVAWGAETRWDYGVSAAAGVETNPLRVSGDGPNGAFTQVAVDGSVSRILSPAVALFANGFAQVRLHEADVADADTGNARLRAGIGFAPRRPGNGRLALACGAHYRSGRSTFIDRETGGEYQVASSAPGAAGAPVAIPGRFDANDYGIFFNARWNQSRTVRFFLDGSWNRSAFINDYADTAGLAPLDSRSLSLEPGVNFQFSPMWSLGVSLAVTDQDYDARPALDENGAEAPGTTREYRYAQLRSTLMITPSPFWSVQLGLRASDRSDAYAGYYDFGSRSIYAQAERQLATKSKLRLFASWSDLEYDRATIPDSAESVRGTDARTVLLRYEYQVARRLLWFADLGDRNTESIDPVFAHDESWVLSGIQFRR
jgi:hypothetical protein